MALTDDLSERVRGFLAETWSARNGTVVPDASSLAFKSEAVYFKRATVMYADLKGSTKMVDTQKWTCSAEAYKAFLYCAGRIIRAKQGVITSYDGDRIMAVFVGKNQTGRAVRSALKLNYVMTKVINPAFHERYTDHTDLEHAVGIDTSEIRAVKTGLRDDHDLVWIGSSANIAAKLSDLGQGVATWISSAAHDVMADDVKLAKSDGQNMWGSYTWTEHDSRQIYGSTWHWGDA